MAVFPSMSVTSAVLSFALVADLLTITPGLDTVLVLRAAIRQGPKPAFATAIGVGTGALAWGAGAAVGVSALLTTSTLAYTALKILGAGYMVWMGVRLLWVGVLHRSAEPAGGLEDGGTDDGGPLTVGLGAAWRRGFLTNLLNPKVGAFYVSLLPQFIPEHTSPLAMGLLLALVHDLEAVFWFTAIILVADRMRAFLARRSAQRAVDGLTGSVLVGFGTALGLSH
jgi:threonine/homoserine/homoserine lactone efflux protein